MPDNFPVTPGTGLQVATDEIGSVHFQRVKVTFGVDGVATDASPNAPLPVVAATFADNLAANFTRPANTTAYAVGDIVANSTTAGSVVPLSFTAARLSAGSFRVRRVKVSKSNNVLTAAQFRVHFFTASPTIANGDNGVFSTSGTADYVGYIDVTLDIAFTDGAAGFAALPGFGIGRKLASGQTLFALLEARAAYTPASAEVFRVEIEVEQD